MSRRFDRSSAYFSLLVAVGCAGASHDDGLSESGQTLVVSSGACEVEYVVSGEWGSGFGANVKVTNRGSTVSGWTLEWVYADGQTISSLWNGQVTQSGGHVTVKDAGWNGTLAGGSSVSFGLNGTLAGGNGNPTGFRLNGVSCEGDAPPPPPPPPPPSEGGSGGSAGAGATGQGGSGAGGSTSSSCEAPAFDANAQYGAGDRVAAQGNIYECKPYPYSGWCSLNGYEPGTSPYWQDAWTLVGGCTGGTGGTTSSGGATSSGGTSSSGGTTSSGGAGGASNQCDAPAWQAGTYYFAGDIVSYNGSLFVAEHENPGYDPVISSWFWEPYSGDCDTSSGGTGQGGSGAGGQGGSGGSTNTSGFSSILSEADFNALFPNRNPFYTYSGLLEAIEVYPEFAGTGDTATRKREAAAFIANVTHETGHLVYIEEIAKGEYCDSSPWFCPCAPGKRYYGRGPMQVSWNYNYCAASQSIFGDREVLRLNPERVAQEPWLAWATALWFWMTQTGAGSMTAHSAMVNGPGFGETIRTINGGLECGGRNPATVQLRIDYYLNVTNRLGVDPGGNLGC